MSSAPAPSTLQPLRRLQRTLQRLYRLDLSHDIADFVTTDAEGLASLGVDVVAGIGETVFVTGDGDAIEISVYLQPQTLARLADDGQPVALNDLCLAAEGVSHFVFILDRAESSRQTSAFELELQAEVDKYLLLAGICDASPARDTDIHARLFDDVVFRDGMDATLMSRYGDANRYAARYCRWLQRLAAAVPAAAVTDELRHFYRLPLGEKVQQIESRPYV